MAHVPVPSPFTITAGAAEVTFTFYYSFDGILRCEDHNPKGHPYTRDWGSSELATYFSDGFLNHLLVSHFHIPVTGVPLITVKPHAADVVAQERGAVQFSMFDRLAYASGDGFHDSIAPFECTLFKNGHMSAVLRFVNETPVSATSLISLIRHPEFSADPRPAAGLSAGTLVEKAATIVQSLEREVLDYLELLDLQVLSLESGQWVRQPPDVELSPRRSRPYVGLLFKLDDDTQARVADDSLMRFVIAAGRPTPAFVTSFQNPEKYLGSGSRNIYGGGKSIVFIARRGWCVFDGREHHPDAFRLGVVETTHFVITAIDTSARVLRRFSTAVHAKGVPIFQQLNMAVNYMVRGLQGRIDCATAALSSDSRIFEFPPGPKGWLQRCLAAASPYFAFRAGVARATSFMARARLISPCEDVGGLLPTHVISHTGRAAVGRCRELAGLDDLVRASREVMSNYTQFLRTSADYLELRLLRVHRRHFWIAFVGFLVGLLGGYIRFR